MKRTLLTLMIVIFGAVALDRVPGHQPAAYGMSVSDDKKGGKKGDKKDPPGPPVVRPKEPKEPPKKDKRP
jgi:hypothetical protein